MQEETYKKIKKSLRFEGSGEEVYVEIGMKNVPPKIKTKAVIDFLRPLFEEAIDQLEDPAMPNERTRAEDPHRSSVGDIKEADIGQDEFEKLMQERIQKHRRTSFATGAVLDKRQEKKIGSRWRAYEHTPGHQGYPGTDGGCTFIYSFGARDGGQFHTNM